MTQRRWLCLRLRLRLCLVSRFCAQHISGVCSCGSVRQGLAAGVAARQALKGSVHGHPPDVCAGAKTHLFCAIYYSKRLFYQDRLGTNIEKNSKRHTCFAGCLYGNRRLLLALLCESLPKALRDAVSSNILVDTALQVSFCLSRACLGKPLSHFFSVNSCCPNVAIT